MICSYLCIEWTQDLCICILSLLPKVTTLVILGNICVEKVEIMTFAIYHVISWELLKVSCHPTKFGDHRNCVSGDAITLVCFVNSQNQVIKGLCGLPSLVVKDIVVERYNRVFKEPHFPCFLNSTMTINL